MKKHVIICGNNTATKEQLFAIFQQRCVAHNKPHLKFPYSEFTRTASLSSTWNPDLFIRDVPDAKSVLDVLHNRVHHLQIGDVCILFLCDFARVNTEDAEVKQYCRIVTLD